MLDGRRIIAALYNDRGLLPDEEQPLPFETRHRSRPRRLHTLFGRIELRRNYHHHAKSRTGRCPLDDLLGLEGGMSPAALLAQSHALLDEYPGWSTAKRDAVQQEIACLESHASRTNYGQYQANGWFIGSGVIEAGCKSVVGRRLKQSGMFWSETGAQDILSLRCLVLGPHFDAAWKARRQLLARHQAKARRWLPEQEKRAA